MNDREKFEKFTERARKVLSLAQEEAERFQHNYIGTEHLLLGLVREGGGVAAKVLANLGVELNTVRSAIESLIGRADRTVLGEIGLTPRAKKVIDLAVDEARLLNHHYIGTEHLLLGLVREGHGMAARALASLGVNLEKARQTLLTLSQSFTVPESPIAPSLPSTSQEAAALVAEKVSKYLRGEDVKKQKDGVGKNLREFDKFTERAWKVLSLAQEEAERFPHNYIGTEHLLLGLLREGGGVAAKVLANLGVELNTVRSAIESLIGRADRTVLGEIGLTPRAKKVIDLAVDEARLLNHHYIGTEHLLLGLVREGQGIAIQVLESLGLNLEKVRTQTITVLSQSATATETSTRQDLPSVPHKATTNGVKADSAFPETGPRLSCDVCGSSCPNSFNYCFHCGSKLKSE